MMGLGGLTFAAPWILAAFVAGPAIWWLLRATPPSPRRAPFPPIELLRRLRETEETPARTPWLLLLLRLVLLALIVTALAGPRLNAPAAKPGTGPLILIVDNSWAAAARWADRTNAALAAAEAAAQTRRPLYLVAAAGADPVEASPLSPREARGRIEAMAPQPYSPDRAALAEALDGLVEQIRRRGAGRPEFLWLSDGLDVGGAGAAFGDALVALGDVTVLQETQPDVAWLAPAGEAIPNAIALTARRLDASASGPEQKARAFADDGRLLAEAPVAFDVGDGVAAIRFDQPLSVRNQIAVVRLSKNASAGGTFLLDDTSRRPAVGLVSVQSDEDQPLLSGLYYVERALAPYADTRRGDLAELAQADLSALAMVDVGRLVGSDRQALQTWIEDGGVLIRFAGPRLAALGPAESAEALLPATLRSGGRALGGALSWEEPQGLAPFDEGGPFAGLSRPDDVVVRRQVLAEPSLDLADRTWARLADGTPLVTAAQIGEGWTVLFHVTADPQWSSLPLSGLFVEMLRRAVDMGGKASPDAQASEAPLAPIATLDGYGRLGPPPPIAPVPRPQIDAAAVGPDAPPGLYGVPDAATAMNIGQDARGFAPLVPPQGAARDVYGERPPRDLAPPLFLAALAVLLIDGLATLALMGNLPRARGRRASPAAAAGLVAALAAFGGIDPAAAQTGADAAPLAATLQTRLAYVVTGERDVDDISAAGLASLGVFLSRRTALEPGEPAAVRIESDEILFYPLLYWPITAQTRPPSDEALRRIDGYMKTGGVILFDTRDQDRAAPGASTPEREALQAVLERMDIPPLEPTPPEHVLTKSFYLLDEFPGRFTGGQVWVQCSGGAGARGGASNDDVSPIVIGGHDWAGAWALDAYDRPMLPVIPGGAAQRQAAMRFGANLAMYTLTGNYKADQVHVPAILERLGQ